MLGFDKAYRALNNQLDWPAHTLELFIQVTHANDGRLSANKRKNHFDWMSKDEIEQAELEVKLAFSSQ